MHKIEQFQDGTAAYAGARKEAWHKLGTTTADCMTAEEAIELAQLNWEVQVSSEPIQTQVITNDGVHTISLPDRYLTWRNHPKAGVSALGVVGKIYTPVQNADAFSFLTTLADESGAVFETAGSLMGGRQVWVSMKMPSSMKIAGGEDKVDLYLVAWNSHDGTSAFKLAVTPIRPVCWNTLNMGWDVAKSTLSLRHTSGVNSKVQQAREAMNLVFKFEEDFDKQIQALLSRPMTNTDYTQFVNKLFPIDDTADKARKQTIRTTARDTMSMLWTASTQENVAGTAWAAFNAAVEYADWFAPIRGGDALADRAERNLRGTNDGFKARALALLS